MKIIINADDLGMSAEVNDAIFDLIAAGHITSATIMANGAAMHAAAQRCQEFPQASFGVHLNASEFLPLTQTADLAPILQADGCFAWNRLRQISITPALRAALLVEWSAQIEKVLSQGVNVSHLDSHHHMHTVPGVFPVIKALQKKFRLSRVRLTMNVFRPQEPASLSHLLNKACWNFALRHWGRTFTTEGFTSFEIFSHNLATHTAFPQKTMELMVHPGGAGFEQETASLSEFWHAAAPFPVELISYHALTVA